MSGEQRTEIRTFADGDRAELRALFERAGEGAPTESLWGHLESEAAIYLYPYMELEPESLFLAFVDGRMAGYLTGSLGGPEFPGEDERYAKVIKEYRLFLKRRPAAFFVRGLVDYAVATVRRRPVSGDFRDDRWPAHLHINVAPEARGTGAAAGLMNGWFERLREAGSPGCHLQTLVENTRAVRFFTRMGFVPHGPSPLVPGLRYRGAPVHQRTMVRTCHHV